MGRLIPRISKLMSRFRPGTRSLKTTLAVYFVPISVLPALFISVYATQLLENSTKETLIRKARGEREAIVAELVEFERALVSQARSHARRGSLLRATRYENPRSIKNAVSSFRDRLQTRVYDLSGRFLAQRYEEDKQVAYISRPGLALVKRKGITVNRYFTENALTFVIRVLLKDQSRVYGVLEEQYDFSQKDLAEIKQKRGVDFVLLNKELQAVAASFALSDEAVKSISGAAFQSTFEAGQEPVFVPLGDSRYAAFLYEMPEPFRKQRGWGHFAVFLSMTASDAIISKLKLAMVYVTALLILVAALLIFIFTRRVVKPIEALVFAMKRAKLGRTEQIEAVDAPYEVEYLVRSFNEMAQNISAAKKILEQKLEELRQANQEIKNTQTTLVQSAKMISLGQLVAGVAHELNNPIAFIYSNMLHLTEYVEKLKVIISEYRALQKELPEELSARIKGMERDLDIDYILADMIDLTKSCVDGANRTKEIVLGLRTFSRMEESSFKESDLRDGLISTIKLLVTEFKDRVTIHNEFDEVPLVECSLSQMNQVFMNLISNAAHAIEGRGDIWVRLFQEGQFVVVEIEDNGKGIPADTLEKIFDPFFTTKTVGEGTGLGLSIAYGLIQKHNGDIQVKSRVNQGTKFTIRLPLRQRKSVSA